MEPLKIQIWENIGHSCFVRCNGRHDYQQKWTILIWSLVFWVSCFGLLNDVIQTWICSSFEQDLVLYVTKYPIFAEIDDVMANTILSKIDNFTSGYFFCVIVFWVCYILVYKHGYVQFVIKLFIFYVNI